MMLKQKSSPWARLKYLYILPLTAVTVVAFARPEISKELGKISSAKISEIVPISQSPLDSMKHQISSFSNDSKERMQKVKKKAEMSRYLILIDDEVATYDDLDKVAPADIYSYGITQKKNCEEILAKHNASDKQGLISIVTQNAIASGKIIEDDVKVIGSGKLKGLPEEVSIRIRGISNGKKKPLIVIDGEVQTKEDALKDLPTDTIESISVLKDESSVKIYGEKGKNGVLLITTKKASENKDK